MPDDPEPSLSDSVPGLLPWQVCFLFFLLGIPALRFPVPCLGAGCVLWLADRTLRGPGLKPWFVAFCFLAGIGYGWARAPQIPEDMPDWMREREKVLVHGVVDEVVPNTGARLRVILRDVTCEMRGGEGEALPGRLVWNWRFPAYDPCPGQRVQVWLRVLPVHGLGNPGQWDYEWYWARQNVFWRSWATGKNVNAQWGERPDDAFWKLKAGLRRAVEDHVPKTPGGGVVLALVSGDRHLVGANAMDLARSAGLSHVLALSGLHVGFVAMIGLGLAHVLCLVWPGLMLRIPRPRLAVLLAAPLVLAYAWLGQPSPSLLRAACMYAAWGVLLFMGRPRVLLDGLFFALACIVIRSPLSVFDLGLQMSAVAVAGIVLLYPLVSPLFRFSGGMIRVGISRALGILGVSMCANLALLPLLSWYFGQLAPNVLFNLVWLPVIGFWVMPLGLLGMVLAPFSATQTMSAWLFKGAGLAVDLLLTLVGRAGEAGATPLVAVLRPWWPEMLGVAVLLCVVIACRGRDVRQCLGLVGMGAALLAVPHVLVMVEDVRDVVSLEVLDVGQAQACVVSLPGGHRWLVDGGGPGSRYFDVGQAVVGARLAWGRPPRLDGVILSHGDADHSGGLPWVTGMFSVGRFLFSGDMPGGRTGERLARALEQGNVTQEVVAAGDRVDVGHGTVFQVLHPARDFGCRNANERSLVLRLVRNGHGLALLPGDVEQVGIRALLGSGRGMESEVLILPHHGSGSSLNRDFLLEVAPNVALCSCGYLNRFGFPAEEVVRTCANLDIPLHVTSGEGGVIAVWEGKDSGVRVVSGTGCITHLNSFLDRFSLLEQVQSSWDDLFSRKPDS